MEVPPHLTYSPSKFHPIRFVLSPKCFQLARNDGSMRIGDGKPKVPLGRRKPRRWNLRRIFTCGSMTALVYCGWMDRISNIALDLFDEESSSAIICKSLFVDNISREPSNTHELRVSIKQRMFIKSLPNVTLFSTTASGQPQLAHGC